METIAVISSYLLWLSVYPKHHGIIMYDKMFDAKS